MATCCNFLLDDNWEGVRNQGLTLKRAELLVIPKNVLVRAVYAFGASRGMGSHPQAQAGLRLVF